MPPLPTAFASLVASSTLPLDDFAAQPLQSLPLTSLRVIARQAVDLLGAGAGSLLVELRLPRADIPAPMSAAELTGAPGFADVVAGKKTVGKDSPDRLLARAIQRSLQALAARSPGAPRKMTLPLWGSDGGFGDESVQGLRAYQEWRQVPVTGVFGVAEARTMPAMLAGTRAPDLFDAGHDVSVLGAGAQRVAVVAQKLVAATPAALYGRRVEGASYAYHAAQFGVEPTPGLLRCPGGVAYDTSSGPYWKCNIFGGTVISLAELPVPTFEAGRYRHFPRAERFGDMLARKPGWQLVAHLDHRDPADPTIARTGRAQDAQIKALLLSVKPGDFLFVDHPGPPGNDGGHTRVCTRPAQRNDADCAPEFAQARYDQARVQRDGLSKLAGGREVQFWHLRSTIRQGPTL